MAKLNFSQSFELTLDNGEKQWFKAGLQTIAEDLVDHWYVQAHLAPSEENEAPEPVKLTGK